MKNEVCALLCTLLLSAGCSVKEIRDACPCTLILDFSQTDTLAVRELALAALDEVGTVYGKTLSAREYMPEYMLEVMRSELLLTVCSGDEGLYRIGKGLSIPYGADCPEVYMYSKSLKADAESLRDTVILHKNHCLLTMLIEKEDSPLYGLCLKGGVSGYGPDGSPTKGDFSYEAADLGGQKYMAVIPRQLDSSLMLEVDDGTEVLKRIALGELINAGGYDWNSPDLEDLTVRIDWASTDIVITVQGWGWSHEYEIVI